MLEATGGYERRALRHLCEQRLPAIRVNPRQVRDFARATGILAKTDAIDARVLVRFGSAVEPVHRPLPSKQQERLAFLQTRRVQIMALRTAESNRLELTTDALITRTIRAVIKTLDQQIELIKAESAEVIAEHKELERTYAILTSVPGVGPVTAAVLSYAAELGTLLRRGPLPSPPGWYLFNKDSGRQGWPAAHPRRESPLSAPPSTWPP